MKNRNRLIKAGVRLGAGITLAALLGAACADDRPSVWEQPAGVPDGTIAPELVRHTAGEELGTQGVNPVHTIEGKVAVNGVWQTFSVYAIERFDGETPKALRSVDIGWQNEKVDGPKLPCSVTLKDEGMSHIFSRATDDIYQMSGGEGVATMLAGTEPLIETVKAAKVADDASFWRDMVLVHNYVDGGNFKDFNPEWITDLVPDAAAVLSAATAVCGTKLG